MMELSALKALRIPEGAVTRLTAGGRVLWQLLSLPAGVYDDVWPLQWNTAEVGNNAVVTDEDGVIYRKISNLAPAASEWEAITLTVADDSGTYEFDFYSADEISGCVMVVYTVNQEELSGALLFFSIPAITEDLAEAGFTETGLYIQERGFGEVSFTLAQFGVYDDTWPIEWNTLAVLDNTIVEADETTQLVKISNLTPSAEELSKMCLSATITETGEAVMLPPIGADYVDDTCCMGIYGMSDFNIPVVSILQAGEHAEAVFPETGLYTVNLGVDETEAEMFFGEYAPTYFDSFPMSFSSLDVVGNPAGTYSGKATATLVFCKKISERVFAQGDLENLHLLVLTDGDYLTRYLGEAIVTADGEQGYICAGSDERNLLNMGSYLISVDAPKTVSLSLIYTDGSDTLTFPEAGTYVVTVLPNSSGFREFTMGRAADIYPAVITHGDITYTVDEQYAVTVTGTGAMPDLDNGNHFESPLGYMRPRVTSVEICDGITHIGEDSFYDTDALVRVKIADSVKSIAKSAFHKCYDLAELDLGNGVESLEQFAFTGHSVEHLRIPASVTYIYNEALDSNSIYDVKTIVFEGTVPPDGGTSPFGAISQLASCTSITVPAGCADAYKEKYPYYENLIVEAGS